MAGQDNQEVYVPVYLADRTVVGKAKIDGQAVLIELTDGTAIQELMTNNLIGMSVVYMNNEARDAVALERESFEEMCVDPACYKIAVHSHGECFVGCSVCQNN